MKFDISSKDRSKTVRLFVNENHVTAIYSDRISGESKAVKLGDETLEDCINDLESDRKLLHFSCVIDELLGFTGMTPTHAIVKAAEAVYYFGYGQD